MRDYQAGNYAAAARLLETACLRKFARSCEVRGAMALEGKTGAVSLKEALEYFEAGCDMEYAHACHLMADTIRRNYKDDPGAMADVHRIWPRACYLGSVEGCLAYAELLAGTEGQTQDLYKALIFLDKACGLAPQGPACQKARDLRENLLLRKADDNSAGSRSARRKRKAVPPAPETPEDLRAACSQDNNEACLSLGIFYEHDPELSPHQRQERALEIFGELCQKRDPRGCEEFRRIKNAFGK